MAKAEARIAFQKDALYRKWAANHGGVYVPVTSETLPNPNLSRIQERDIITPSGRHLTLINPAYMTRQVFEQADKENNYIRGHITSLNPIRKENAPDPWERNALKTFENGAKEFSSLQLVNGRQYLRLMRPFNVEQPCLKCHAAQGYKLGDIRGGISVSVPMTLYSDVSNRGSIARSSALATIWFLGMGLIAFGSRKLTKSTELLYEKNALLEDEIVEREMSQKQLQEQTVLLEEEIAEREMTQERLQEQAVQLEEEISERQKTQERLDVKADMLQEEINFRMQSEEALRKSEASLQLAQRAAKMGSWTWYIKGNQVECSKEMFQIFGVDQASFSGDIAEAISRALHPDDRHIAEQAYWSVIRDGKPIPAEFRILWPDVTEHFIWAEAGDSTLDEDGNLISLSGYAQDITERKKAQVENHNLECQLQQAQKMESIGRLAGGVAHDFNNMLTVINGYSHLGLMESEQSSPLASYFEQIRKTSERSADLTRQLLAFARKQTIAPKILELNETVAGMLKMLQRLIGEEVKLSWQPDAKLWPVKMDPSQIDQLLANLCVNARDAINTVGKISIETGNSTINENFCSTHIEAVPGEYVRITVSDNGHGMDKETLSHIFEPFFTTKRVGEGTGLGLATIYGIVKQNNGFINVYSEPGLGTTFTIFIPRYGGMASQDQTEKMSDELPQGHETILVVEDEPAILNMTKMILEKQGYSVLGADTPKEAIRLARDYGGEVHLLLTDVVMPEMSGRDLANVLVPLHQGMKLLFMSGYTADIISNHGVLDELVNFIQKPFSVPDITVKVREVLDSKQ